MSRPLVPIQRLLTAQRAHPWRFIAALALVTALAGAAAATLRVDASYEALLPTDAPRLAEVRQVRERAGGLRHVVVAVTGDDRAARRAFATELAEALRRLDGVRRVDLRFPMSFFEERGLWLVDLDELRGLADAAERAVEGPAPEGQDRPVELLALRVEGLLRSARDRIPFGEWLESRDGGTTFLWVVPVSSPNQLRASQALLGEMEAAAARLDPGSRGLAVRASGMAVLYREQQERLSQDLSRASLVALALCALIVALGMRWAPAPLVVCAALIPGIVWTFALVRTWSATVNLVTGFLVPVLLGLGIDFALHLVMRYLEERRRPGQEPAAAVTRAVLATIRPISASALTTAATFFCFAFARFPGFREFGLVAGLGVLLSLVSTFLILPPLLVVLPDRRRPRPGAEPEERDARLRLVAGLASVALLGLAVYGAFAAWSIPYYNDFRRLHGSLPEAEFNDWVNQNLGFGTNPAVIVVDTLDDARRVAALARQTRSDAPSPHGALRIAHVLAVTDLLPDHVDERRALIGRLGRAADSPRLEAAARRDRRVAEGLRRAGTLFDAQPFGLEDLPEVVRRRFVTQDGERFLVYLWPTVRIESDSLSIEWERQLTALGRRIRGEGVEAQIGDEVLIHGWISRLAAADAPVLIPAALLVVLLILAVDQRSLRGVLVLAGSLAVGVLAYLGAAAGLGLHFNMFNVLAVPMVLGIGIDAAVHVLHRYQAEGPGSASRALRCTGRAVLLASATSAAGFGSSLVCHHLGLRSLGTMALLGIAATTISGLLLLPTLLTLLERTRARKEK